jgi:hypothetical protein
MFCCSRETLFIFLGVVAVIGILIATGKVNPFAILPFLPFLLCPLMCGAMMLFGRNCKDDRCMPKKTKSAAPSALPKTNI